MKKTLPLIILVSIVILLAAGLYVFFSSDPPIDDIAVTDCEKYRDFNPYIKRLLKESYAFPFPAGIPQDCQADYYYSYRCNFDGDIFFVIYLELAHMGEAAYENEAERLSGLSAAQVLDSGGAEYICFSLPDREKLFSDEYSQRGFRSELVSIDKDSRTIRYLSSYLADNRSIPRQVTEMLQGLLPH